MIIDIETCRLQLSKFFFVCHYNIGLIWGSRSWKTSTRWTKFTLTSETNTRVCEVFAAAFWRVCHTALGRSTTLLLCLHSWGSNINCTQRLCMLVYFVYLWGCSYMCAFICLLVLDVGMGMDIFLFTLSLCNVWLHCTRYQRERGIVWYVHIVFM